MAMSNYYLYNNKIIDLNLLRFKNEIAISLSRYFDESNLLKIQFNDLCINYDTIIVQNKNSQHEILYNYVSEDGKTTLELIRELDVSRIPMDYYINLYVHSDYSEIKIKCKIDPKIGSNLNNIIGEALNYVNYGSITTKLYNRKEIQNNFSKVLAKYCSLNNLMEAKDKISTELDYDKMLDENSYDYEYKFSLDDVTFELNNFRYDNILFGIIFSNVHHYLYLPKSQVGLSMVYLTIDKAIAIANYLSQI